MGDRKRRAGRKDKGEKQRNEGEAGEKKKPG